MGASYHWEPVREEQPEGREFSREFIHRLQRDVDGGGDKTDWCATDLQWLRGFAAGSDVYREETVRLIDAIELHGEVEIVATY